tara:strand:+ start:319 stop:891 length:573 start_codon:yes stop_codon:yes gene_type:complete
MPQTKEEKKQYQKEYREKNKEILSQKQKEHRKNNIELYRQKDKEDYQKRKNTLNHKEYQENNKDKKRERDKLYYQKNKDKKNQQRKEWSQTEQGKKLCKITDWKSQGIKSSNFDLVYERYINTNYCEVCNIELTHGRYNTKTTRCLDHQHASGEIRNILCHHCNTQRKSIDLKHMYVLQELHRYFNRTEI